MNTNLLLLSALGITAIAAVLTIAPESNFAAAQSAPVAANSPPILIELFTSQGCSSCPPADRVLAKIDGQMAIVALSRPVTYWDRLGWKDTLARPANDVRQRRYAARGLPGGGVYTPEAVVQGRQAVVGSDEAQLRRLIASARTSRRAGADPVGRQYRRAARFSRQRVEFYRDCGAPRRGRQVGRKWPAAAWLYQRRPK